ncbi:MAG: glycosyltransferase [Rhizobiales bacterium]|nr:glycosyltransferase [Hyphomicrobiales bacterium]
MSEVFNREYSRTPLEFSGERLTSAVVGGVVIEHYHRYFLARDFCSGRDVLDIAAGEGYGSALLAQVANSVIGVEIDAAAVEAARRDFPRSNLRFVQGDARAIPMADASVDVAVSFETYEHIAAQETFLKELRRVLRPGGVLIISTPDRDLYSAAAASPNPHHVREASEEEFVTALAANFVHVRLARQRVVVGSFIETGRTEAATRHFEAQGRDLVQSANGISRAPYLIVFASDHPLPALPNSLYIEHSDVDHHIERGEGDAATLVLRATVGKQEQELENAKKALDDLARAPRTRINELEVQLAATLSAFAGAQGELERLTRSVSWRVSAPLRHIATRFPGLGRRLRQVGKVLYWAASGQLVQRIKASLAYRYAPRTPDMAVPASSREGVSTSGLPTFLETYLGERWPDQSLETVRHSYRFVAERENGVIDAAALSADDVAALLTRLRQLTSMGKDAPRPSVSIIIPVHNALAYTLACLLSLLDQPAANSFEVLIADDASTDATATAISSLGGKVRLIRHKRNLGFVRNCNAAAASARGDILVFLNNDTIVLPGWLDALVAPLNETPEIGLTCSKLLNADGTLQEAGGVFWQDGSAWNYGRGADPRAYLFNFVRDTDYGSGAAIAVRSVAWASVGGFDDRFSPAYCEDADLAFGLRAKGYRTIYVPTAEIIHHEGVSHGRDEASGIKAYQVENLKKFSEKWADTLRSHSPKGQRVAMAAARSRFKPRILVIDHYVPQWDRDAGSRAVDGYLRFLVANGFHVTFWPDNRARDARYGPVYQDLGIEVVYAWPAQLQFRDWIADRGADFDYVLVSRPHVAMNVLNDLKDHTRAKLMLLGVDLHGARLRMERDFNHSPDLDREIEAAETMEATAWGAVDAIYYPSREEAEQVAARGVAVPVRALPLFQFDESDIVPLDNVSALRRPGQPHVMFVGGFRHRPNVDGILWFCRDVWPLVRDRFPAARLTIAGAEPPLAVTQLAGDAISVTGYISDADLHALYRSSDVVVAPLRFGAGVKGKVLEALRQGLPLVLTSVAAQGIEDVAQAGIMADDAAAFARGVIELLQPGEHRMTGALRGQALIRRHYSVEALRSVFALDMPELARHGSRAMSGENRIPSGSTTARPDFAGAAPNNGSRDQTRSRP